MKKENIAAVETDEFCYACTANGQAAPESECWLDVDKPENCWIDNRPENKAECIYWEIVLR